MDDLELL